MKKYIQNMVMVSLIMLSSCGKSDPAPDGNKPIDEPLTITSITPMQAVVGAKVVIMGTGFSKNITENTIKFGNTAAVIDSASQTRLVTRVPQGAQRGKISVMVNNKTVSSATEFEVSVAATLPVFATITGANATSDITSVSAKAKSTIDKLGSEPIIQHGHVWIKGNQTPSLSSNTGKTELGQLTGNAPLSFSSDIKNLDAASTYTVRAYVTTQSATTYSDAFVFTSATSPVSEVKSCRLSKLLSTIVYSSGRTKSSREIDFKYDANGRISQMSDSKGGKQTYEYDNAGRLVKAQELFDAEFNAAYFFYEFSYDGTRLVGYSIKLVERGSVTYEEKYKVTLNNEGLLSQVRNLDTGEEISFDYIDQNIISIGSSHEATGLYSTKLTYDQYSNAFKAIFTSEAHKLIGLLVSDAFFSWGVNNIATTSNYEANVLTSSGIYSYTYDSNGYPTKAKIESKYISGTETATLTFVYDKCQ